MIHEAGHLAAAKIFNVYCDDYSIGFGPAILHKKPKNKETYFSIRAIPFGGFVSMASDIGELRPGLVIPKERTIKGIKRWKAAIIMSAGVIMNVLLSITLLFVFNVAFPKKGLFSDVLTFEAGSKASEIGLVEYNVDTHEGDFIHFYSDPRYVGTNEEVYYYDVHAVATFEDDSEIPVIAAVFTKDISFSNYNLDNLIRYFTHYTSLETEKGGYYANYAEEITANYKNNGAALTKITLSPIFLHNEKDSWYCTHEEKNVPASEIVSKEVDGVTYYYHSTCDSEQKHPEYLIANVARSSTNDITLNVVQKDGNKTLEKSGLSLYYMERYLPFNERVKNTFQTFGESAGLIFRTIGGLFVGQGWNNVGSIVQVYTQQATIFTSFGPSYLIYYWGLISINLAIVNLLPFPGLDGWQLLVLAIEGSVNAVKRGKEKAAAKKNGVLPAGEENKEHEDWRIPEKVKNIVSYIGLGLLFVLMAILILKDVVGLF